MKIHIKLNNKKSKQTKLGSPIVVYVTHNYKEREWATGYYAKKNEWNNRLVAPNSKHPQYYLLLDHINELKGRILNVLRSLENSSLSFEEIKKRIFNKDHSVFYDAVIALVGDKNYNDTRYSAITNFNKMYDRAGFSEISYSMVERFISVRLKEGRSPSGVDSYVRSLRKLWNDLSDLDNPFSKHKIEIPKKIQPVSPIEDIRKLYESKLTSRKNSISGPLHYRNYWLLMFFLGGIDPEVLVKLRYDKHVVNGRINFNRDKGRSKMACSVLIPEKAWEILEQYDCKPYLVPIAQSNNPKEFIRNMSTRMNKYLAELELSVKLRAKSARFSFVGRAQELLIDERLTAQIVGHKRRTTTSLYTNEFSLAIQDEAHLQIIEFSKDLDADSDEE